MEQRKKHANFAIEIVINGKIEKQTVNSGVYGLMVYGCMGLERRKPTGDEEKMENYFQLSKKSYG